MKKVKLENINVENFTKFLGMLTSMSSKGTVYFTIDSENISSDSYLDNRSFVKSLRYSTSEFFSGANIDDSIKFIFFHGKKLKDSFSYLNGSVSCTIHYDTYSDGSFCTKLELTDGKVTIKTNGADPSLVEFASIPQDKLEILKDVSEASASFRITSNELNQIKTLSKLDSSKKVKLNVTKDKIYVSGADTFDLDLETSTDGINREGSYGMDKELITLVENEVYNAYVVDDAKVVFKSIDSKIVNILAFTDEN